MAGAPWFKDGLRFECTQCGDCCTGAPGFVWVNQEEIEAIAKKINVDLEEFEKKYVRKIGIRKSLVEFPNGDCVFFDTEKRNCSVYERGRGSAEPGPGGIRTPAHLKLGKRPRKRAPAAVRGSSIRKSTFSNRCRSFVSKSCCISAFQHVQAPCCGRPIDRPVAFLRIKWSLRVRLVDEYRADLLFASGVAIVLADKPAKAITTHYLTKSYGFSWCLCAA